MRLLVLATWLVVALGALASGMGYYTLPLAERAYSPLHELYSPAGSVGHGFGVVGTLLIVLGVTSYSLRKRLTVVRGWGRLSGWLRFHIFLCTLGPFLVLLHTSFKFGGLVVISFWSMALVVGSGVFGRYIYVRIPKSIHGQFLTLETVAAEERELREAVAAEMGLPAGVLDRLAGGVADDTARQPGLLGSLGAAWRHDITGPFRRLRLAGELRRVGVAREQRRRLIRFSERRTRLHHQIMLLRPFQRLFRYWHVIHLPLTVVMFLILAVHVAVAIAFGYTWIFQANGGL